MPQGKQACGHAHEKEGEAGKRVHSGGGEGAEMEKKGQDGIKALD
jgi:hypothetical protein